MIEILSKYHIPFEIIIVSQYSRFKKTYTLQRKYLQLLCLVWTVPFERKCVTAAMSNYKYCLSKKEKTYIGID